jgi:glycosyltransferase involved in cell wall biosynthesis
MGVADPGFIASESAPGTISLVSCSLLVGIKRIDLMVKGVADAARRRPEINFVWHHFGEGELRPSLESLAKAELPSNVDWRFPGYPGPEELLTFYRESPVDVFMNTSASEGTSVAMMEAISCGLPVLATSVGGNPEIVSAANGILVGENPTPGEIGEALLRLEEDRAALRLMRTASREVWVRKYDAAVTYGEFAKRLVDLRRAR